MQMMVMALQMMVMKMMVMVMQSVVRRHPVVIVVLMVSERFQFSVG